MKTHSVCPWKTETEFIASRKSHNLKVVSLDAVTTNFWEWCDEA